jgi:hypothetical protein
VEDPCDTNAVDVADSGSAKSPTLPTVDELIVVRGLGFSREAASIFSADSRASFRIAIVC